MFAFPKNFCELTNFTIWSPKTTFIIWIYVKRIQSKYDRSWHIQNQFILDCLLFSLLDVIGFSLISTNQHLVRKYHCAFFSLQYYRWRWHVFVEWEMTLELGFKNCSILWWFILIALHSLILRKLHMINP